MLTSFDNLNPNINEFLMLKEKFEILTSSELKWLNKKAMAIPYKEYLKSPYWIIIRNYLIYTKKQCEKCKSQDYLEVHHKNYKYLGIEILHLYCLIILCRKCHSKNHPDKNSFNNIKNLLYKVIKSFVVPTEQEIDEEAKVEMVQA